MLKGQALPLEADPTTFSVVLWDQVNAGFASDMPAFGEMAAGTFAGTFSGTFDDGDGNQLEASGRFGYY